MTNDTVFVGVQSSEPIMIHEWSNSSSLCSTRDFGPSAETTCHTGRPGVSGAESKTGSPHKPSMMTRNMS